MTSLLDYDWPGNIRELENVIEYAHTRTRTSKITEDKLPPHFQSLPGLKADAPVQGAPLSERERIQQALESTHWNRSRAAELLGVGRATLWRKMKAYDML